MGAAWFSAARTAERSPTSLRGVMVCRRAAPSEQHCEQPPPTVMAPAPCCSGSAWARLASVRCAVVRFSELVVCFEMPNWGTSHATCVPGVAFELRTYCLTPQPRECKS